MLPGLSRVVIFAMAVEARSDTLMTKEEMNMRIICLWKWRMTTRLRL
jgi:hypothetical protein